MAAPTLDNLFQNIVENIAQNREPLINKISSDLVNGKLTLITFVESLQQYLTSTDVSLRSRCVRLIGEVLHQIPNTQLSEDEVELLVTYMCEKLTDHHSIQPPALYALMTLSGCRNFKDGLASKICRLIFQNVQNQSLAQGDRCNVYTIISRFLDTRLEELQKMEGDFVLGFIQLMDAEKDSRNLMICFQCARTVILNFSLGVFVEEMFEVTSCYFPIDFTPPPNDSYKINREDLIKGLRGCLCATEKFAEFAYPLIIEKLTSDIQSAKLDCLQTLIECIEVYGIKHLIEYQSTLYNCIKSEIFSSGNTSIEEAALGTLQVIVRTLSKSLLDGPDSPIHNFIYEVLQDCKRYLTGDDNRLLVPVCRILLSCAQGSDAACCLVLQDVLPNLISLYNMSNMNKERKTVLEMISKFVKSVSTYSEGQCHRVFLTFLPEISTLIRGALSDSSAHLRISGISGVNEVIKVNSQDTQVYTELILDKIFNDQDKEVRKSCLQPLKTVSEVNSDVLESTVIPKLLDRLKTRLERLETDPQNQEDEVDDVLSEVTVNYSAVTKVSQELLQLISRLSFGASNDKKEHRTNKLVNCLLAVIQKNTEDSKSYKFLSKDVCMQIYKLVIESSIRPESVLHSSDIIGTFSKCIQCIVIRCDKSELEELYGIVTKIFLHGDLTTLYIPNGTFNVFDVSSPWQQTQLISMALPVICTYNQNLPDEDLYVQKLVTMAKMSQHRATQISACKCLAGLLNKYPEILQKIDMSNIEHSVQNKTSENRLRALNMMIWITKALVMRGHQNSQAMVLFLVTLLSDPNIGCEVAEGFTTILSDSPDVLNKSMNAVIRMMYKQRLFVENISYLVKSFDTASQETRKNYLKVLSSMLKTLPKQVLLNELPPLFPLMIHSLLSDDPDLQMSTMETLYDLTHDAPEIVSKHVDSLIPQLLKIAVDQSSMKIRQNALQCVGVLTVLPVHIVLPYKGQVIKGLEKTLDDNKRLVRKEAVTARNEWFLLGTTSK